MIKYKGYDLGPECDLYNQWFYVADEADEVIEVLRNDIAILKEMLREEAFIEHMNMWDV
jgi:hypothetical protein